MAEPVRQQVRTRCENCSIRTRAICAYCGPEELARLDAIKSYKTFPKGAEIVRNGERTPYVGTVVTGVVALSRTMVDGRRQMVGLQFPSDFVGGAIARTPNNDAVAASDVLMCQMERGAFETLLKDVPALKDRLLEVTSNELDAAQERLMLLGQKSAAERVASFVLMLLKRASPARDGGYAADVPITRAEIGEYLGLTIETVSRQFSKLKGSGLIRFETTRRVSAPDLEALAAAAGDRS